MSKTEINFLDTTVLKVDKKLRTKVYVKPIDRQTSESEHPNSTYYYVSRTLTDLKTIIDRNWHILQIKPKLKEIFAEPSILAFKRNKNARDIIGGNKVFDNKKKF